MFVYCCKSDACTKHIHKLLSENKFVNDVDEVQFMLTHQGRTRANYEMSAKTSVIAIAIIGAILTGYALYRILHLSGIC